MAIFQNSVVREYAKKLSAPDLDARYKVFQGHFLDPRRQEEIRKMKEEEFKPRFLPELFGACLGYTIRPDEGFNFTVEHKNVDDSKKADAAILSGDKTVGVVEVKATDTTDLTKAATQAFGYKNHQPDARYVVVTNFEKLRFYVDNAVEFEEFDLFRLDRAGFERLFLCLAWESIRDGLPLRLKAASVSEEDQITKRLYADYSAFRGALFADIRAKNSQHEPLLLFKKTQKLIDRFLFILFAEDRGLLPANLTASILAEWQALKKARVATTLYDRFKLYFNDLLEGNKEADIFAYNGGLFRPDAMLDALAVSDDVLAAHALMLSNYDFASEVDVDILGHIFEHSLSEIEEVEASLSGTAAPEKVSKRKKDGIFYTPKYITQYIVENTLGKLCAEKKQAIGLDAAEAAEPDVGAKKARAKRDARLAACDAYREWLLGLSICDPACGSGAFLNAALDFLMAEHRALDVEKARLHGDALIFSDIENSILERNLYGVDLNEESVEIAKLSLWLRTAQKGRKLSTLTGNIKCGNSLISDPVISGDKAFDWPMEFPAVFEKGGFDIVIGNPPYVNVEMMAPAEKEYYKTAYPTFFKRGDLFGLFLDRATATLTATGFVCLIVPSIVLNNLSYKKLRERLLDNKWLCEVCTLGGKVFADATVDTVILTIHKQENSHIRLVNAVDFFNRKVSKVESGYFALYGNNISVGGSGSSAISDKLFNPTFECVETHFNIFQGVVTGNNKAFIFDTEEIALAHGIEKELLKPLCHGRDIGKWEVRSMDRRILYLDSSTDISRYPGAEKWLMPFKGELEKRRECANGVIPWYALQWARKRVELDITPKIAVQNTRNESLKTRILAAVDLVGFYSTQGVNFIIPKGERHSVFLLVAILNSKLINNLFATKFLNLAIKAEYLKQLRFPKGDDSEKMENLARMMVDRTAARNLQKTNFLSRVRDNLPGVKVTGALESFEELDFAGFLAELKKQKQKLALSAQAEWEGFFNQSKAAVAGLAAEIAATDREIDKKVYALYGLTDEEILIVEKGRT